LIAAAKRRAKGFLVRHLSGRARRRLKRVYRRARAPIRVTRRRLGEQITPERLAGDLRAGGIRSGDTVMVHSALSRVGNVAGGAEAVIESLVAATEPGGTILMPIYGDAEAVFAAHARGERIDLRTAAGLTGKVPEAFRSRQGVRCSSHPFSSVCAWGAQAEYLTRDHAGDPRVAHAASPIGRLLEIGGKVVGLGVSLGPVSFYHVLEDTWDRFPHRVYLPPEELTYVDHDGREVTRAVHRYDPVVRRTRIDQPDGEWIRDRLTEHLRRKGLLREFRYGASRAWSIDAGPFYDELKRLAKKGVTIYLTEREWAERGEPVESW
jgi:aminoglycoside 3-N-acetyltransferase